MSATTTIPAPAPLQVSTGDAQHVVLYGVRWETYKQLADDMGDRPIHLTYDDGVLEIMTLSSQHERLKKLLGRLIELATLAMRIPICSAGSTTFQAEWIKKGLEPDDCYYIRHESDIRDKPQIDLANDPPPDLAVEIEVNRSAVNRLKIYAAMGVPEVWRFDGENVHVHLLDANGVYQPAERSMSLPQLPVAELVGFLKSATVMDETSLMWSFLDWLRQKNLVAKMPGDPE